MPLHVICIHHAPSTRHTCASTPVSAPQEKTGHTVAGGRDRVEADAIGLVLLGVDAGGEHAVRLALPVGKLACKQSVCVAFSANLSFKGARYTPTSITARHKGAHRSRGYSPWWSMTMLQVSPGALGPTMRATDTILPMSGSLALATLTVTPVWSQYLRTTQTRNKQHDQLFADSMFESDVAACCT